MVNKSQLTQALRPRFNTDQIDGLMSLFKIAPVQPHDATISALEAMKFGLVFLDDGGLVDDIPVYAYSPALTEFGIDVNKFNQTFYKSFSDVRDASPLQLIADQLRHYLTTYGAEAVGVEMPTFIPNTALEVPDMAPNANFKFTVINFVSDADIVARVDKYLSNLAAPNPMVKNHILAVLPLTGLDTDDIRSFELQVVKHKADGTVPKQPVNQLRYIVHVITGETLLIKNRYMRDMIHSHASSRGDAAFELFQKCSAAGLASIFLRYKPIFLAFKKHSKCAPIINHLRRLADAYHKPLPLTALQNFTQIDDPKIQADIVAKATNRDLIKLLNSINTRVCASQSKDAPPAVYQVRNGRTFVRENAVIASPRLNGIGQMIYKTLVDRLTPALKGKTFFVPKELQYAIPTSEKQFIGAIPFGTRIVGIPQTAFTAGIHWVNQRGRTDIDLHMNSASQHFGWNAACRKGSEILYTGDMTDAPVDRGGAAEAYWFSPQDDTYILTANLYSGDKNSEFKFMMTEKKPDGFRHSRFDSQDKRFTFDPNDLLFTPVKLNFVNDNGLTLGMFSGSVFYFYGGSIGYGVVPTANYEQFIAGLTAKLNAQMVLNPLLEHCGAKVIHELPTCSNNPDDYASQEDYESFMKEHNAILASIISLSPEDLVADTLINIIDGNL